MITNLIALCLGAAVALLVVYCSVQARIHTTAESKPSAAGSPTPGATLVTYNSSASAVSGIWLFFQIYAINAARAKFPQLQFPSIMYSIFVIVACTYSPQVRHLLKLSGRNFPNNK
jgi:glycerol uptake facilitator-like aquaporin